MDLMLNFSDNSIFGDGVIVTVGFLLPFDQASTAINLSRDICDGEKCSFQLDMETNPPRIRLYETVFPRNKVDRVMEKIGQLANRMSQFPMHWGEVEMTPHFVAVWGEKPEPMQLFHDAVLESLSALRQGYFKEKYLKLRTYLSQSEENSLEKWGSPWAKPYNPHMILAKAEPSFIKLKKDIDWDYHKCILQGVIVGIKCKGKLEDLHLFYFSHSI